MSKVFGHIGTAVKEVTDDIREEVKTSQDNLKKDFQRTIRDSEKVFHKLLNLHKEEVEKKVNEIDNKVSDTRNETAGLFKRVINVLKIMIIVLIAVIIVLGLLTGKYIKLDKKYDKIIEQLEPLKVTEFFDQVTALANNLQTESIPEPKKIESKKVEINLHDITAPSNLSAEQLNEIISTKLASIKKTSTAMSNIGESLVKMETDNNVNALFCLAVASIESGHGTSSAARNKNNLFGIMSNGSVRRFNSIEENILYWGKLIREKYINQGRTTVNTISTKYCARAEHWSNSVHKFLSEYRVIAEKYLKN